MGGLGSLTSTGTSVLLQGTLTTSSGTKQACPVTHKAFVNYVSNAKLSPPCEHLTTSFISNGSLLEGIALREDSTNAPYIACVNCAL